MNEMSTGREWLNYDPKFAYPRQNVKYFLEDALRNPDRPDAPTQLVAFDYFMDTDIQTLTIVYMINNAIGAKHMAPGSLETFQVKVPVSRITRPNPNICHYGVKYIRGLSNA